MTLDMFRVLQSLEYEPQEELLKERQGDASMVLTSPRPVQPSIKHDSVSSYISVWQLVQFVLVFRIAGDKLTVYNS